MCLLSHPNDSLIEGKLMAQITIAARSEVGTLKFKSDSLLFKRNSHYSLGGFLEKMGWVNVTSYGAPGSLITARINGSSSDHAAVFWNAVPLTNPALGLTDLSLVPMALFDAASVKGNQNLIGKGQGGLGGTISLDNALIPDKSIELNSGLNSLSNSFLHGIANYRVLGIQMRTVIIKESNRNEFDYTDVFQIKRPIVSQHHNNSSNAAWMQSAEWNGKRGWYAKAQWWYQVKSSHIPDVMGSNSQGTAEQRDSLMRGSVTIGYLIPSKKNWIAASPIELLISHNREFLHYTDRAFAGAENLTVDSKLQSDMGMQSIQWKPRSTDSRHRFHLDARNYQVTVFNTNYAEGKRRETFQSLHLSYSLYLEKYHTKVTIFGYNERREDITTKPSYGGELYFQGNDRSRFIPNVRAAFAHRFRTADFNERFWVPGGNRMLLPEEGDHASVEFNWSLIREKHLEWNVLSDAGLQRVNNWIQWVPGPSWTPMNYKEVDVQYLGVMSEFFYKLSHHQFGLRGSWKWSKAEGRNDGSADVFKMIYTPEHTFFGHFEYQYKLLEIGIDGRYVDIRYTNEENSIRTALEAYYLFNAYIGFHYNTKKWSHSLVFTCDNATDVAFQSVRSYAMPQRFFGIQYRIKLKINQASK